MILSICIPNFNRSNCLDNCLNSILISKKNSQIEFEICISDNHSSENIEKIVNKYKEDLNIKFHKNSKNLGFGKNIMQVVSMAKGTFVWIIGNDDLILPNTLSTLDKLFHKHTNIDFFFINSFNLNSKNIFNFPQPFDTKNLPTEMKKFSEITSDRTLNFFELINPKISFDFLLGIYLSVFRKEIWDKNMNNLLNDEDLIKEGLWSTFDNTCPYIKIFAKGFAKSKAFIQSEPLSVNLFGEREWSSMYEFIEIVRIPETLDVYRKYGMKLSNYLYCKNFALRNFSNYLIKMIINKKNSGLKYLNVKKHVFNNLLFPNVYFSVIYYCIRKIFKK